MISADTIYIGGDFIKRSGFVNLLDSLDVEDLARLNFLTVYKDEFVSWLISVHCADFIQYLLQSDIISFEDLDNILTDLGYSTRNEET